MPGAESSIRVRMNGALRSNADDVSAAEQSVAHCRPSTLGDIALRPAPRIPAPQSATQIAGSKGGRGGGLGPHRNCRVDRRFSSWERRPEITAKP